MGDSILSGLREYKMSRRKTIKVRIFPGATINDIKFFAVPLLKKRPDKVIIHVGTNDPPHFTPAEMLKKHERTSSFDTKSGTCSKSNHFVTNCTCRHSKF